MYRPLSHYLLLLVGGTLAVLFALSSLLSSIHSLFPSDEERQLAAVQTRIEIERATWELEQERAAHLQQAQESPAAAPVTVPDGFCLLLGLTLPAALAAAFVYVAGHRQALSVVRRTRAFGAARYPGATRIADVTPRRAPQVPQELHGRPTHPAIPPAGPAFQIDPPIPPPDDPNPRKGVDYEHVE